jgi:hypothetical protein
LIGVWEDEGFMATGYASDETDAKIQESIIAVGYEMLSTGSVRERKQKDK